ncbi:MAG: deaminase, partial [Nanoarchaeota archaeon]|nr:deaminase [Nanoarchaeota archaeon]
LMIENKGDKMLFVCGESGITCATFRVLQRIINESGKGVVLAIPEYEYKTGKRGMAKTRILASVAPKVEGVLPLDDYESTLAEIQTGGWGEVYVNGTIVWVTSETIESAKIIPHMHIDVTSDPFDLEMMERTKEMIEKSNCWLDPAGAVFVSDGKVLVESTSTSFNGSRCREIPINFAELDLNAGERIMFCDSLHAERMGISEAAKRGIPLTESTMYVSKFPCRPCAMSVIAAGITTIVFEKESYGLLETADLFEANNIALKKIVRG